MAIKINRSAPIVHVVEALNVEIWNEDGELTADRRLMYKAGKRGTYIRPASTDEEKKMASWYVCAPTFEEAAAFVAKFFNMETEDDTEVTEAEEMASFA